MSIEQQVGRLLLAQGLTLALAESCTGGQIGDRLTNQPGSSAYFLGSAVTYAYSAKEHLLGVDHNMLLTLGAVSAEVARQMAQGARRIFGADIGVAVTGIAGPGGGTPDKPVGLAHLHLSAPNTEWPERHVWSQDRLGNKRLSADAALALLLRYLQLREGSSMTQEDAAPAANWTPTAVDAWRTPDGEVHVRAFTWRGALHIVAAAGRRWQEENAEGIWRCVLVQTAAGDTFELRYQPASDRWLISGAWLRPRVA